MDKLFKEFREDPPVYKNQPPVAGAVHWERSLFLRIKHTIIRFQTMEEMMTSEQGKAVSIDYDNFSTFKLRQLATRNCNLPICQKHSDHQKPPKDNF